MTLLAADRQPPMPADVVPARGAAPRSGRPLGHGGRQLQPVLADTPPASSCCCSTATTTPSPARVIPLDPADNRTYHYWHAFVPGVTPGQLYGYRVAGAVRSRARPALRSRQGAARPLRPRRGRPEAATTATRPARPGDNAATAMKSVVVDPAAYDWEGDVPLRRPSAQTIIYEMHVRGFTRHPSSGVGEQTARHLRRPDREDPLPPAARHHRGGAAAGVPVRRRRTARPGKVNYWGYAPVSFFAPHQAYSSRQDPLGPVDEFRDMVKALHRAGIEVILDVVFNHTAEGDQRGPTLCFRGLDNPTYYILEKDRSRYANYTGCGNTLNANHPIVRRMIVDSLRYWVERDARGRLPLRPRVDPGARRVGPRRCRTRRSCGTSSRTRRWPAPS